MTPEKLSGMANQIAGFFRSYPEAEATAGVRHHLAAFWTPAMLRTLRAHVGAGAMGVDGLVVRALEKGQGSALDPPKAGGLWKP